MGAGGDEIMPVQNPAAQAETHRDARAHTTEGKEVVKLNIWKALTDTRANQATHLNGP